MDKQKQIEEMAKDICAKYNNGGCEIDGYVCNLRCDSRIRAEICYEQGYRKIPEGAAVVSKAEYNDLKGLEKHFDDYLIKEIVEARKETAEKFAERVKMAFYYEFDELIPSIMADKLDEIAKEITEELK